METRPGSASDTVRDLEPRVAQELAREPPTNDSVVGMAEILEAASTELEAHTQADTDPYELMLVARFLRDLVEHVDQLMARADVPVGPGLDRVRLVSKRLEELSGRVDSWFKEGVASFTAVESDPHVGSPPSVRRASSPSVGTRSRTVGL